jgi:hypothetical protein
MKKTALLCLVSLAGIIELSGCGSPPPPTRSAKAEISSAESAIQSGDALCKHKSYDQAKIEYEHAIADISKAQGSADDIDGARLSALLREALDKKVICEQNARRLANELAVKPRIPAAPPAVSTTPVLDPEAIKLAEAKAREAKATAEQKALQLSNTTKKKIEEPEDAGDVTAAAKAKDKAKAAAGAEGTEPEANPKAALKDKAGIFPNVTESSPPLQVVKLTRVGKFVVAYVQLFNKGDDGKRFSVASFFKNSDNQVVIESQLAHSYPYENFSLKVKDLIGDQPVRTFTANSEEVGGHDWVQFVCVGECASDEAALKVVKVYVKVMFNDGKGVDATGPEGTNVGGALDRALPKLLK